MKKRRKKKRIQKDKIIDEEDEYANYSKKIR